MLIQLSNLSRFKSRPILLQLANINFQLPDSSYKTSILYFPPLNHHVSWCSIVVTNQVSCTFANQSINQSINICPSTRYMYLVSTGCTAYGHTWPNMLSNISRQNPSENWVIFIFSGQKPCTRLMHISSRIMHITFIFTFFKSYRCS